MWHFEVNREKYRTTQKRCLTQAKASWFPESILTVHQELEEDIVSNRKKVICKEVEHRIYVGEGSNCQE